MNSDRPEEPDPGKSSPRPFFPRWFVICASILVALIVLKALGLQVFIEIQYDGVPFLAGLTEIETYLVPFGLLGIYFLWCWLREKFFGPKDV